jgi:hypothetical protein
LSRDEWVATLDAIEILVSAEARSSSKLNAFWIFLRGRFVEFIWAISTSRGAMLHLISTTGDRSRPRLDELGRVLAKRRVKP